jgi:choline kinase
MEAKKFLQNEVLVLYSDIIFDSKIINEVLNSKGDISIAVDLNWKKSYIGRTEHPKPEAENVLLNKSNKIIKIKKNIQENNGTIGEFLGIIKFSSNGSKLFVSKYEEAVKTHENKFQDAESISKAYLTDMLQELIDSNIDIYPMFISGNWCEIDTMQDLRNAEKLFKN